MLGEQRLAPEELWQTKHHARGQDHPKAHGGWHSGRNKKRTHLRIYTSIDTGGSRRRCAEDWTQSSGCQLQQW